MEPISAAQFTPIDVEIADTMIDDEPALRVTKSRERYGEFDADTFARLSDALAFHNGIIEVDMMSRLLPDAPDYARGFIGVVFRADERNAEFESFYIRPTNGMTDDPIRRAHGCQYFSYPGYTFGYFRHHGIDGYEAPITSGLDEWVHLKAVVEGNRAAFYLNGASEPTLSVDGLKHGDAARGAIGLYVDDGTEAYFRNLSVAYAD